MSHQETMRSEVRNEFLKYLTWIFVFALLMFFFMDSLFDDAGDAGSFMQAVLGSAVALAGAYVAIKIAGHALGMQKDQESRDKLQAHFEMLDAVSNHVEKALIPLVEILKGIQTFYKIGLTLKMELERIKEKYPIDRNLMVTPELKEVIDNLREQHTRPLQIALDSLVEKCSENSIPTNPIGAFLLKEFATTSFDYHGFQVSVANVALWGAQLGSYRATLHELNDMDDGTYLKHIVATHGACYLVVGKDGQKLNNASLRAWLFLSFLLSGSLSAAVTLKDWVFHLPDGKSVLLAVRKLFPVELSEELAAAIEKFDLSANIDDSLQSALRAHEELGPLELRMPG